MLTAQLQYLATHFTITELLLYAKLVKKSFDTDTILQPLIQGIRKEAEQWNTKFMNIANIPSLPSPISEEFYKSYKTKLTS